MSLLDRIFGRAAASRPSPPAPARWTEEAVVAWLDARDQADAPVRPTDEFEWTLPDGRDRVERGPVLDWAFDARATTVFERLLKNRERALGEHGDELMRRVFRQGSEPYPESIPMASLLHASGIGFHQEDLEWSLVCGNEPAVRYLLPYLKAQGALPPELAARAAASGISDALMAELIESGLRFDRATLTQNISFGASSGNDATRAARVDRWMGLLELHEARCRALALDTALRPALPEDDTALASTVRRPRL